jgi:hypothetical protein
MSVIRKLETGGYLQGKRVGYPRLPFFSHRSIAEFLPFGMDADGNGLLEVRWNK